ncbi:MAG: ABC transporter permease [Mariniblastus sp.]|nr:ABC transporter permease [Mariniblastus sp.]
MSMTRLAWNSLGYYWRSDTVIAIGVAIATAVLTGALIVGDSMRGSLQALTLERLGRIDELLISEGFFRQALADELSRTDVFQEHYETALPAILFPNGSVESQYGGTTARSSRVMVIGIVPEFWQLGDPSIAPGQALSGRQVALNATLAEHLGITQQDVDNQTASVTVRIPKPSRMPADSTLGRKTELVASLVDLQVTAIVPTRSLGRFGLYPSQANPANLYLPIDLIADELSRGALSHKADQAQCNTLLIAAKAGAQPPAPQVSDALQAALRPALADMGLQLKRAELTFGPDGETETVFDYFSLSSDRMVLPDDVTEAVLPMNGAAQPVLTYLANDMARAGEKEGIPFSMVSAIDFDGAFQLESVDGDKIAAPRSDEIILNQWAAEDLQAQPGDKIRVTYFEPETTHGNEVEKSIELKLSAIAKLTEPVQPPRFRRRQAMVPAVYDHRPSQANDPDLTPQVPGVTDAESIEKWDLPFNTADRIRPEDDDYWTYYRTTPKAFVNLELGRKLWGSRFGETTSIRIPRASLSDVSVDQLSDSIRQQLVEGQKPPGFELVSIKRRGLEASSGSTPFDVLFLALSMFVMGAALILVSLLFRLALAQRVSEMGVLLATGFTVRRLIAVWLIEMLVLAVLGAVVGALLGLGYAALIVYGLQTWWVGAISRPFLNLYVGPWSMLAGTGLGILVGGLTIYWSIRRVSRVPARDLLTATGIESPVSVQGTRGRFAIPFAVLCLVGAIGLAILATRLGGEPQAGAFMGAGFLVLVAGLIVTRHRLKGEPTGATLSLGSLAVDNARRAPVRSTLTIGLVAVASFLIMAVSSFRLSPTEEGTAGFTFVAQSDQPVFVDLNTDLGRAEALGDLPVRPGSEIYSLRFKSGEDASCNNLYQSTQPQVLGLPDALMTRLDDPSHGSFQWAGSLADTPAEKENPWQLLKRPTEEGAIPVVIDKNTANYSLKIFAPGGTYTVDYDSGETVTFRVVGFLSNSLLQGNLIISEDNFVQAFPSLGGYRYFLINEGAPVADGEPAQPAPFVPIDEALETSLSDVGFDVQSARLRLQDFMQVQNTYISTFQSLGALGLLLGTFGLAAVQIRSVLERRAELGLLQAVGFSRLQIGRMILIENSWLLLMGMVLGVGSALFTTLPHYWVGGASVPWVALSVMFALILLVGLVASWVTTTWIARLSLIDSLRA